MSTVQLRGLLNVRKNAERNDAERALHLNNDVKYGWMRADRAGKCYTYRGVKYYR